MVSKTVLFSGVSKALKLEIEQKFVETVELQIGLKNNGLQKVTICVIDQASQSNQSDVQGLSARCRTALR